MLAVFWFGFLLGFLCVFASAFVEVGRRSWPCCDHANDYCYDHDADCEARREADPSCVNVLRTMTSDHPQTTCWRSYEIKPVIEDHEDHEDPKVITAFTADNVLLPAHASVMPQISLFDPFDANLITYDNSHARALVSRMEQIRTSHKKYLTTNHAYILVELPSALVLVATLDNSELAEANKSPVTARIYYICEHVRKIRDRLNQREKNKRKVFTLTFTDGCRASLDQDGTVVEWTSGLVPAIEAHCGVTWHSDTRNNEINLTAPCMSTFVFPQHGHHGQHGRSCGPSFSIARRALSPLGSGAVVLELKFGLNVGLKFGHEATGLTSVWIFNFAAQDDMWLLAHNVGALTWLLNRELVGDGGLVCALGNLNTKPGSNVEQIAHILRAADVDPLIPFHVPTYFGAEFDLGESFDPLV
jgi:hypothetical protein